MVRRVEEEILDSLPSGVLYVDRAGRVRYLNRVACRFLSVTQEEARGAYLRDLWPAAPAPSPLLLREPRSACLHAAPSTTGGDKGVLPGRDGLSWQYQEIPISRDEKSFTGTLMVLEELQAAPGQGTPTPPSSCRMSAKGEGSRISHALNQCLQVLMGCLSLLNLELDADHASQKYVDQMQDQLEKLRLLALSLSQGKSVPGG